MFEGLGFGGLRFKGLGFRGMWDSLKIARRIILKESVFFRALSK